MKITVTFIFLFVFSFILKAQNIDVLAEIPNEINSREIRIYKSRGIYNSGIIFRIFQNENKWKAETSKWFLPKETGIDEFERVPPKKQICHPVKILN